MKTFILLLTLSALASPFSAASADNKRNEDSPVSFTGTWKTIAGGTHKYTVTLKQIGKTVTGSYAPGNGKIFDGVVSDNKLSFKWTQDGGFEGTGEFTMDEDGKGFTGSSTALKPQEFTNTWNTYKPETASFAGNWETISDGQNSHQLTVVQTGNKVTGIFPSTNGKLEGTVSGSVLRFKWESDSGSGSGRFVMDEGTQAFSGTYNRGDNPDEVEATWNGKRAAYTGGKSSGSGTGSPISFAGDWKGRIGNSTLTWKFKQTGDQVTGEVQTRRGTSVLITDGIVAGNTLRFTLNVPGSVRNVEFVMDKGGKSFKGEIGAGALTTFVRL